MLQRKDVLSLSFLFILCGYLFFFDLGKLALTDPDETFYAQTAKEMLSRGEWVTPYLYGRPQFEKPVLFYWLVEASYRIFGINEFASRLPSAVFALIGVFGIYLMGRLLFGASAALLSALSLATSVEYIILSRACITDMVLTVFLLLGLLSFLYGYLKEKKFFYMLAAAFLGLAVLTKGPVYIMLAAAAILAFLFFTGGLKSLAKMPLFQSALVFMAVALPWYIIVYRLHGSAFTGAFFGFHNVNRFLEAEHKIGSQIYYNVPVALGGFFPWSAFLPFGLWYLIRQLNPAYGRKDTERKGIIFALVWLAVIFGFFTASSTKLPTYIFPCFISLALIVGVLLEDFVQGIRDAFAGTTVSYFILVIIIIAGSLIAPLAVKSKYPALSHGIAVSSAFLALGMIVSAFFFAAKRYMAALVLIVYAVVIFLYPLSALVIEPIERLETSKDTAERLVKLMAPGDRLGSESNYLAGLAFYTGIAPSDLDKHHDMVNFMNSGERVWVVMKEKNHVQLYDPVVNPLYVKPSYVVHKAGKRAIVTNEAPSGGKYLARRQRP